MKTLAAQRRARSLALPVAVAFAITVAGCGGGDGDNNGADGPVTSVKPAVHQTGNAASGQQVFRFETFGNERF